MSEVQTTGYIYQENRKSTRQQVDFGAKGIIPRLNAAVDCTVLDISETGALIELGQTDIVPENFKLFVPGMHMLCECNVVRQSGKLLGLEFQSSLKLKQDTASPAH